MIERVTDFSAREKPPSLGNQLSNALRRFPLRSNKES